MIRYLPTNVMYKLKKQNSRVVLFLVAILIVLYITRYVSKFSFGESGIQSSYNDSTIATILEKALEIKGRPVLITLVNDGYLNMVYSWLCNTKHMGFHKQVLIVTTQPEATEKIKALSPDISAVVIDIDQSMNGNQEYSHVGYVKLMILRTQMQLALVERNIEMYAFECDSVFLKNPIPLLHEQGNNVDIVFISNYKRPKAVNGGFLYLFPHNATKATFAQLNKMMLHLAYKIKDMERNKSVPTSENDQVYLSKLHSQHYAGLRSKTMPFSEFADGKWYEITEAERKLTDPYLIHNNWIIGIDKKETRAKQWGHWFLKEDGTCDFDQVKKVVK